MKSKLSLLSSLIVLSLSAHAQESSIPLPEIKAGECTALVVVPAKFEPRTERVLIKEEAETIEIIPAEYEWVEEQVEVKAASKRLEIVPAVYKTVEEAVVVEPESVQYEVVAPQYQQVAEEIIAKPAYRVIRSEGSARTFSSMGEALRLDEVPAKYETVSKQAVQESASVKETSIAAKTMLLKKQVLEQDAQVIEHEVPAVYETVRVKKLVNAARQEKKVLPAEYAEVTVFEKIADADVRWENVLCNDQRHGNTIEALQRALQAKGYKVGSIDGAMGPTTQKAVEKFQRDHNLAVGGVTQETLQALGISH